MLCMQNGLWYTAIGAQPECVGAAELYTSPDFQNWTFAGTLASQISVEENTMCVPSNVDEPQVCPQKGTACRTWECPDFWVVDGVNYLKYSDQVGFGALIMKVTVFCCRYRNRQVQSLECIGPHFGMLKRHCQV